MSFAVGLVSICGPAVGCGVRLEADAATAEGRSVAPIAVRAPGPLRVIGEAFGEVPLDALQRRAVRDEITAADRRHAVVGAAMRAAANELAEQVARGAIDRTAMRPRLDAIADALAATQPLDRAAIARLQRTLDIEQRQLLADVLEERFSGAREDAALHEKWAMWRSELALTDEQQSSIAHDVLDRIGWGFHWGWGHDDRGRELLEAFVEEEDFDIDEVSAPIDVHAAVASRGAKVLDVVEVALPHLTPRQREIAANHLRRRGDADLP